MSARDYVIRRPAQVRPAPESGVRLVEEKHPRARDVRAEVEALFRSVGARVYRDDDLVGVREGGGW